jgi:glycosyltransferase involved in cell wall biosynthesis
MKKVVLITGGGLNLEFETAKKFRNEGFVSIIIPTYNEEKMVERLFVSVEKQTFKNIEIIVVDDNSSDNTVAVAKRHTQKVYTRKHAERSVQRNFGAKKAKGEFFLFLDADMELTSNVISDCVRLVKKDRTIGGVIIPEESKAKTFWEQIKAFERSFYNEVGVNNNGDQTTDAARFFRREVFEKVGGYDENITGPEDWDLPESIKKKGYKIGRIKSKILHYERIPNLFFLVKKKYYYALKSHTYLKKQNISVFSPKTIYFLRPVFYKNWKKLILNPIFAIAMFIMFFLENIAGGAGYLIGRIKNL